MPTPTGDKKLRNIGQRTIEIGGHLFRPNTTVEFPVDVAARLMRLYGDEVQDFEAQVESFKGQRTEKFSGVTSTREESEPASTKAPKAKEPAKKSPEPAAKPDEEPAKEADDVAQAEKPRTKTTRRTPTATRSPNN